MIPVNKVYQRLLIILNKENRGYVTKDEFNSLADQVQQEIFESYFTKKALSLQGENDTDFANPPMNVEEKITFFDNVNTVNRTANMRLNYSDIVLTGQEFYRLGIVDIGGRHLDEAEHKDVLYINLSPLTAPTIEQAVYTRHEGGIQIYPLSYGGNVTVNYLRRPTQPQFNGTVVGQQTIPGVMDDVNFELHPSEEHEIVTRMLSYFGVVTRDADVAGFGSQQTQQITAVEQ